MQKITIKAVAEKAGVSTATVSYLLSGKKKISPEVAENIRNAIDELGYKPSILARNLASNKNWTIGLYTSSTKNIRKDFFFNDLISGILDCLHEKRYQLQLYADYLNESSENHPDLSMTQPIDGALIMNPRIDDVYLAYVKKQDIPFLVIGTPKDTEKIFYVDVDLIAGAYMATNHLITKGHKRILFINGPSDYMQSVQHEQGIAMAFAENRLKLDGSDMIHIEMLEEAAYEALKSLGNSLRDYTAIVAFHDVFTLAIISYLKENNISIPQDMAYVSLGNTQICRICSPALTSIDLAPYSIGYSSAEMLLEVIEKRRIQPSHAIIPARLVERESV